MSLYFFERCTLLSVEYFRLVSLLKARTVVFLVLRAEINLWNEIQRLMFIHWIKNFWLKIRHGSTMNI